MANFVDVQPTVRGPGLITYRFWISNHVHRFSASYLTRAVDGVVWIVLRFAKSRVHQPIPSPTVLATPLNGTEQTLLCFRVQRVMTPVLWLSNRKLDELAADGPKTGAHNLLSSISNHIH